MKHDSLTRLWTGIAVAAAFATLAVPTALAGTNTAVPDDLWFNTASQADTSHDPWFLNYAASSAATNAFVTDTLAPGGGSTQTQGYRFMTDTLAPGGGTVAAPSGTPGFDWDDAGIGAGTMLALMLILLAGTRLFVQKRRNIAI